MEMAQAVEAIRAGYSESKLFLPEFVRYLIWKQVRDVTALPDALNYEVWQEHSADTGRRFWLFSDPLAERIADDSTGDIHEIAVYIGHSKRADFAATQTAISTEQDGYFHVSITEQGNKSFYLQFRWNMHLFGRLAV